MKKKYDILRKDSKPIRVRGGISRREFLTVTAAGTVFLGTEYFHGAGGHGPSTISEALSPSTALQTPSSSIVWVTESLREIFIRAQYKFIGVVPGNYIEPTSSDYSIMRRIFSLLDAGISKNDAESISRASSLAGQIDYQLLAVNDSSTGNKFYVLMEGPNVNRGWGSYFFVAGQDRLSLPRVIIEAPHPVTDLNSQNIAYEIFVDSYPGVFGFFVSGVERTYGPKGQTDMAHRTLSIFETATEVFAGLASVVIQIHSFWASRHPQYPWVVLSTGDGGTNGALESIASSLRESKISVGIFDGFKYEAYGATTNVQGRYVRAAGGGFVHVEIASTVVYDLTLISDFQQSVVRSLIDGFKFPGYLIDLRIPAITFLVTLFLFIGRFRVSRVRSSFEGTSKYTELRKQEKEEHLGDHL